MRPRSAWMIAAALLVMLAAGCYPVQTPGGANATAGTPAATQPTEADASPAAGAPAVSATPPEGAAATARPPEAATPSGGEMATQSRPAPTEPPASPAPSTPAPAPAAAAAPTSSAPGYDPALQPLVELAVRDLAGRLDLGADRIEVVEAQEVVWPDSSLGCPQPGKGYLQVLIDGARIVLRAADRSYAYHSGRGNPPFLCIQKPGTKGGLPDPDPILTPPLRFDPRSSSIN